MRTVFTNPELLHIFAQFPHREQTQARTSNGNLSFRAGRESSELYSYSTRIATMGQREGELFALITTRSYSVTTSGKHMPSASMFPPGVRVFHVDDVEAADLDKLFWSDGTPVLADIEPESPEAVALWNAHRGNVEKAVAQAEHLIGKARRARVHGPGHLATARRILSGILAYADFFGVGEQARAIVPNIASSENIVEITKRIEKAERERREREKRERAQRRAQQAEELTEWRNGSRAACPASYNQSNDPSGGAKLRVMFREHAGGYMVETSEGASCPGADALAALKMARLAVKTRREIVPDAPVGLGSYRLDRISAKGDIRAGCHLIRYAEAERIAPELIEKMKQSSPI